MIFVTLGSQKFQFNRLLQKIDELIEKKVITEEVFAQIGASDYQPQYFEFQDFMDREDFLQYMRECDLLITHAGTGTIISAIKRHKVVIAIPRLAKYGEHVDDHQLQIISKFGQMELICACLEVDELDTNIVTAREKEYRKYTSNTVAIMDSIDDYLQTLEK